MFKSKRNIEEPEEILEQLEEEKIPKSVKPRKADTRKELEEATEKMLSTFNKLNERITEINTNLHEQKLVLEELIKSDKKVHSEIPKTETETPTE